MDIGVPLRELGEYDISALRDVILGQDEQVWLEKLTADHDALHFTGYAIGKTAPRFVGAPPPPGVSRTKAGRAVPPTRCRSARISARPSSSGTAKRAVPGAGSSACR